MAVPLPTGTRWVADLPDGGTTTAGLPGGTRAMLPGRMYVPPPIAASTAEGILTALASPTTTAAFTSTGTLTGVQAPASTAAFAGEGVYAIPTDRLDADGVATGELAAAAAPVTYAAFSASGGLSGLQAPAPAAVFSATGEMVIPTSAAVAPLTAEGHLAATAVPTALAQFSASTDLTVTNYPAATAPFTGAGTLSAPLVASSTAPFSGAGTLGATASSFKSSGMNKSGSYTMTTSYAEVPTWTADTGTYPGSSLSGNGLVVQVAGTGNLSAQIAVQLPGNSQTQNVDIQFYKNGTTLLGTAPASPVACTVNTTTNVLGTLTGVTLAQGDVITIRTKKTNSFSATVVATNTWVRILAP
ncbi:hypothetical protein [Nocardia sp. NPDC051833]|uniref:hypothetical protein n=1 Tax=Nocardia sp. NPDC051833 TaxID=3155674 RepID=UPI0034322D9C